MYVYKIGYRKKLYVSRDINYSYFDISNLGLTVDWLYIVYL